MKWVKRADGPSLPWSSRPAGAWKRGYVTARNRRARRPRRLARRISLAEALAASVAVYGKEFNGALSLKALTYFADGDLPNLSPATQKKLRMLASEVNLSNIPGVQARVGLTGEESVQR